MLSTQICETLTRPAFQRRRNDWLTMKAHAESCESQRISRTALRGRLMIDSALAKTIQDRTEAVKKVVNLLAQAGRADDLHDLRVLLINTMSLLKRDPGTEAAVDDLYAAAAVLVKDASSGTPPSARSLRILLSASDRFCMRLGAAADRIEPQPEMRLKGLEAAYAVQLERFSMSADLDPVGQVA
ncbi:hypothetical protein [Microvirga splendida]|uniref:Uncharacterized protein n=1 Tax=Microvirga splendida TaxID=2795727 RepID=A0ABS0Y4A7_9HYPH|nr:hypothetical protein [Microvirga splendida]MBJ6127150.1 hypothetical protein [Microvirga splendida]